MKTQHVARGELSVSLSPSFLYCYSALLLPAFYRVQWNRTAFPIDIPTIKAFQAQAGEGIAGSVLFLVLLKHVLVRDLVIG